MNLLNSRYDVIQAPMAGGILTPELIAAVINAGMIGSVASGYLTLSQCENFIAQVVQKSSSNFILNIFIENERTNEQILMKPAKVIELEKKLGVYQQDEFVVPKTIALDDYLYLIDKYKIPAVSTTFGLFPRNVTKHLQQNGVKVIASATSAAEAVLAFENGVDALVVQGFEAGGHQASFFSNNQNLLTTRELLQQIKALNTNLPLIATGGISLDSFCWYLANGAAYVQLGSLFMLTELSALNEATRQLINLQSADLLVVSKAITGKWVRGIRNNLMEELEAVTYDFPIQHYATAYLRAKARELGRLEYAGIWLGQHQQYAAIKFSILVDEIEKRIKNIY